MTNIERRIPFISSSEFSSFPEQDFCTRTFSPGKGGLKFIRNDVFFLIPFHDKRIVKHERNTSDKIREHNRPDRYSTSGTGSRRLQGKKPIVRQRGVRKQTADSFEFDKKERPTLFPIHGGEKERNIKFVYTREKTTILGQFLRKEKRFLTILSFLPERKSKNRFSKI